MNPSDRAVAALELADAVLVSASPSGARWLCPFGAQAPAIVCSGSDVVRAGVTGGAPGVMRGAPGVLRPRTQPDVHLVDRVLGHVRKSEQTGLVLRRPRDALDECAKIQSDNVDADTNFTQVRLDQRGYGLPCSIPRIGDQRELHLVAVFVPQHAVAERKAFAPQRPHRELRVEPQRL